MADLKAIKLYSGYTGPNPYKVALFMEELGLPYEFRLLKPHEVKQPEFEKVNPNGRVPAIEDPNTSIVLWESAAIVEYLLETYDTNQALSYDDSRMHLCRQWAAFQISGQGPYFGQAGWFTFYHSEKIPSAIERYADEMKRIVWVLDTALARNGTGWLVGDKCTFADLCFYPWNVCIPLILGQDTAKELYEKNQNFKNWQDSMAVRPAAVKMLEKWNSNWALDEKMKADANK